MQAVYHIPRLKEGIIGSALGIIGLAGVCLILHLKIENEVWVSRNEGEIKKFRLNIGSQLVYF